MTRSRPDASRPGPDCRGRSRRLMALVAAAAFIVTTVACTDDGDQPAGPTTAAPTTTAAPQTGTVDCGNALESYQPPSAMPAPGNMPPGSTMRAIQDRGRLIVGVSADTMLFGARDPITGDIEGFDIDVLREVARAIFGDPNAIEYRVITYAQRLPVLEDQSVDLVAHTMTINCVRWERIAFSTEYFSAGQKVLVRSDSAATEVEDLGGQRVCAAEGSTNIENIANVATDPPIEVVGRTDLTDCLVAFQQGVVDAITGDDTVLEGFKAQDPFAKVIGRKFTDEPYGVGVNLQQVDLVRFVNGVLEQMRADGRWQQIHERWLGAAAPEGPPAAAYGRDA